MRLDGSVPQKKRQEIVNRFQNDPQCRLFITTNAGSTGLNLQAANTVINVDLPWNPAVLEQRIGRAHRMGQKQPVQVYVLVTEETIEESLLGTLSAKHDLALAALDPESDVTQVDFKSGVEELRRRLEVLLGAKPEAPVDVTKREEVARQAEQLVEHRDRVAAAGGEMFGAVFSFLGELVSQDQSQPPAEPLVAASSQPFDRVRGGRLLGPPAIDRHIARPQRVGLACPNAGPAHVGRRQRQSIASRIVANSMAPQDGLVHHRSSVAAKIALFHSLFRGRDDVYPRRFESRKTGKSGYQPACAICDRFGGLWPQVPWAGLPTRIASQAAVKILPIVCGELHQGSNQLAFRSFRQHLGQPGRGIGRIGSLFGQRLDMSHSLQRFPIVPRHPVLRVHARPACLAIKLCEVVEGTGTVCAKHPPGRSAANGASPLW